MCLNTNGSVNLIKGITIGYKIAEIYANNPSIRIELSLLIVGHALNFLSINFKIYAAMANVIKLVINID